MNNPELLTTSQVELKHTSTAPEITVLHVCSRWLFDCTTAVSPEHAGPSHLRMCLQRWHTVCGSKPTRRGAGNDFECRPPLYLTICIPLQRAGTRSRLLLGLRIGAGRLEKHEDVVA
jgi:hypothetical protein